MQNRALYPTLFVLFLCVAASAQSGGAASAPELNTIITRMMQAQQSSRAQQRAYVVTRKYQVFDKSDRPKSQVLAEISFLPPDSKEYRIREAQGSGQGTKAVKKILEHETDKTKDSEDTQISPENYNFQLLGSEMLDGREALLLSLEPKRKHKDLLNGKLWLDPQTFLIRRIEGKLSKSPSWWVKDVDVVLTYGDVEGMWMQTGTKAVANIRFFGKHTLIGKDLSCDTAVQSASSRTRKQRRPAAALAGYESALAP